MYCQNCKTQVSNAGNFCAACGARLQDDLSGQLPNEQSLVPDVGRKILDWKGRIGFRFDSADAFPIKDFDWLYGDVKIRVTETAILVFPTLEPTKFADMLRTIGDAAGGGIGGALLVRLPLHMVSNAYDNIARGTAADSKDDLSMLFQSGAMIWCAKSEAVEHRFEFKPLLFVPRPAASFLRGRFHSVRGDVNLLYTLFDPRIYRSDVGERKQLNVRVDVVDRNLTDTQFVAAFSRRFPTYHRFKTTDGYVD